jgi:hypothetical protein
MERCTGKGRLDKAASWGRRSRGRGGAGETVVEHAKIIGIYKFPLRLMIPTMPPPATVAHRTVAERAVGELYIVIGVCCIAENELMRIAVKDNHGVIVPPVMVRSGICKEDIYHLQHNIQVSTIVGDHRHVVWHYGGKWHCGSDDDGIAGR